MEEVYWVFTSGLVISSLGFGDCSRNSCGKSKLLNELFFTDFQEDPYRHMICKGCPEIMFDIFKNTFKHQIHLIDIPSNFNEQETEKLITHSNMMIIHTMSKDLQELQAELEKNIFLGIILVFLRDDEKTFSNLSEEIQNFQNENERIFFLNIPNLSKAAFPHEINVIKEQIHQFIQQKFQNLKIEKLEFSHYFENKFNIEKVLQKLDNTKKEIFVYVKLWSKIIENEENLEKNTKKLKFIPEIAEILELIKDSIKSKNELLILQKLSERFKLLKAIKLKKFYKLYEFKKLLTDSTNQNKCDVEKRFLNYIKTIQKHKKMENIQFEQKIMHKEYESLLDDCVQQFEENIKPEFISIELFWRELIYYYSYCKTNSLSDQKDEEFYRFLINLKKSYIFSCQPFEIIDGDILYMAKDFLTEVFKDVGEKVAVISIIGPQSSGKSTLLNFLFGCDFVTSEGRCTKGIYGTFFKVSNLNNFDGILVLDTEGLFSVLNKKEAQKREEFDRKIVLFCMAVSNFVIINVRGDLSSGMKETINVCLNSNITLFQGNMNFAELIICLNQNNESQNEHSHSINTIYDLEFQ